MNILNKILVIRFSSIGDIVLTTPIVRALKTTYPDVEIHFLIKQKFQDAIYDSPYITKILYYESIKKNLEHIKNQKYDIILDLQSNFKSLLLCIKSGIQYYRFPKRNISKILYVLTKRKKPIEHIVTRYADTLKPLGIRLDASGLDFFISIETSNHAKDLLKDTPKPIYALVLGASYPTKMWVTEHIISFIKLRNETVLLLGGISEKELGERIANQCGSIVVNMAGKCNLKVSAALLQQCKWVLTPDTGMMHIAAALHKPIVVLWGNTTPYFGMAPWKTHYVNAEVEGLGCRPCSKIGYKKCPKGHFRCMNELTPIFVNEKVEELLSYSSK